MTDKVFFIGYMGSGKSTIGRFVAKDMGWDFIDMDDYFEQKMGKTISDYFADHGEEGFRVAEAEVVKELAAKANVVVSCGGGAPCFYDNMEVMNNAGLTIYINVEPTELAARLVTAKSKRPIIAGKSDDELVDFITAQLARREAHYRKARMIVDGVSLPFTSYKMLIEAYSNMENE